MHSKQATGEGPSLIQARSMHLVVALTLVIYCVEDLAEPAVCWAVLHKFSLIPYAPPLPQGKEALARGEASLSSKRCWSRGGKDEGCEFLSPPAAAA